MSQDVSGDPRGFRKKVQFSGLGQRKWNSSLKIQEKISVEKSGLEKN
jgi:hypothetical protein